MCFRYSKNFLLLFKPRRSTGLSDLKPTGATKIQIVFNFCQKKFENFFRGVTQPSQSTLFNSPGKNLKYILKNSNLSLKAGAKVEYHFLISKHFVKKYLRIIYDPG